MSRHLSSPPSSFSSPSRLFSNGSQGSGLGMQLGATSPADVGRLLAASSAGDVERMKEALAANSCTVNDGDYDHRKPLHLAAAEGRIDAVKFLVEHKADVNAEDRWGNTALDEAVTARHDDIIQSAAQTAAHSSRSQR